MPERKPVKIIFDTDIGCDCDDAGALAVIHRLCDKGEAELLAVTHCQNSPYYAGCIDSINRFYNRSVPVGINYNAQKCEVNDVYAQAVCEGFPNSYPAENYGKEGYAEDTLALLRKTLDAAEDGSVTLIGVGTLASLALLIKSHPDEYSHLSGKELIEKKIRRTVIMGGRFFESWPMVLFESGDPRNHEMTWEYNIKFSGYDDASTVFDNWPGELVLSSYEIGSYIVTMVDYGKRAGEGDPVSLAYKIFSADEGRCSWDHTAALEAIRPGEYWSYHEFGKISVDTDMVTHWGKSDKFRHTYLLPKTDYEEIRRVIDSIVYGE